MTVCIFTHPPTILDCSSLRARRIFGVTEIPKQSVDDAAELIVSRARAAAAAFVAHGRCIASLTAGTDTRTSLAILLPHSENISFFTYNIGVKSTVVDINLAKEIAEKLNLSHDVLKNAGAVGDEDRKILQENTFTRHGPWLALSYYRKYYPDVLYHIRSNIIEFFRTSAVDKLCSKINTTPNTYKKAAKLYMAAAARKEIRKFRSQIEEFFRYQFEFTDYKNALKFTDSRDLYFIEHRMAAWHSNFLNESDIAFDTAILFNSREILDAALSVGKQDRLANRLIERIITASAPELLNWPINPEEWP